MSSRMLFLREEFTADMITCGNCKPRLGSSGRATGYLMALSLQLGQKLVQQDHLP